MARPSLSTFPSLIAGERVNAARGLTRDGQRYFGLLQVVNGHTSNDFGLVIGLRNSHDKSFPEFCEGKTAWRLFNAFTELIKGNLTFLPRRTQALHGLMDVTCNTAA